MRHAKVGQELNERWNARLIDGMGRRRGKSTKGGEAALLIVGAMIAAAVAIYHFVVENAAVIGAAAIVCGGLYLLLRALFRAGCQGTSGGTLPRAASPCPAPGQHAQASAMSGNRSRSVATEESGQVC